MLELMDEYTDTDSDTDEDEDMVTLSDYPDDGELVFSSGFSCSAGGHEINIYRITNGDSDREYKVIYSVSTVTWLKF